MVQRRGMTHLGSNLSLDLGPHQQAALSQHAVVQERSTGLGGIAYIEATGSRLEVTAITHLPTRLCVERRLVQDHNALLAFIQDVDRLSFFIERDHFRRTSSGAVAGELGGHVDLRHRERCCP